MIYPALTICGIKEARQIIDQSFSYIISILSLNDRITRPTWLPRENHLLLFFDDVANPAATNVNLVTPKKEDIEKLIAFGRKIHAAQSTAPEQLRVLLHCNAGRARSPAAGYILLCYWYGPSKEEKAAKEVRKIAWHCWPNPLMIQLADVLLKRRGEMIRHAVFE